MHVTNDYFIQLVEFDDNSYFYKKTWNVKVFLLEDWQKNFLLKKLENTNIGRFLRKLRTTGSIESTVMIDFKMCCLCVVSVLPGSVETQLGYSGKFY